MLKLKAFYMIRHAESEANVKKLAAGTYNYQLTDKGIMQATYASNLISSLKIENIAFYSSPLSRALDTAKIISNNSEIKIVNELRERDFGLWEGRKWEEVLKYLEDGISPPNGETTFQHILRSKIAFEKILNNTVTDNMIPIIVTHGGSFYTLGRIYGFQLIKEVDNCELYYFEPDEILVNENKFPYFIKKVVFSNIEDKNQGIIFINTNLYN